MKVHALLLTYLLAGGGRDVDEACRRFLSQANGGDVVVLRAAGTAAYDPYFQSLSHLHSVKTIITPSRSSAEDPSIAQQISHAQAIFLAGGDQWNYLSYWRNGSVGRALQAAIDRGVPIGGTSAGLAVLGEYSFSAEYDTVQSADALRDPYDPRVAIAANFLHIPALRGVITDSHFSARERLGRTLVFLARMITDFHLKEARAIAVDERTAALLEKNGQLDVAGQGSVFCIRLRGVPRVCEKGRPLSAGPYEVYRLNAGAHFDTTQWTGTGGAASTVTVTGGQLRP